MFLIQGYDKIPFSSPSYIHLLFQSHFVMTYFFEEQLNLPRRWPIRSDRRGHHLKRGTFMWRPRQQFESSIEAGRQVSALDYEGGFTPLEISKGAIMAAITSAI